jgi:RNA polymerase sigma-70 factor (ECF subfamily)
VAVVPTMARGTGALAQPASADEHAELLYERLYDRVYGYCLYRLGNREEAEDAAQVTFFQALRGLRRGVVPRVETAWVFAIAKNVCLERHKSRGRRRNREILLEPAMLDCAADEDDGHSEEVAQLREALTHLPGQQREAVLLREWRGLSYREIAAELGLSLSAVETLIFRARRSLAQQLADEPAAKRSPVARAFALGPLVATLKGALGGSAAKVAVAAALAAAAMTGGALVGGAGSPDKPREPAVLMPADLSAAEEPIFLRPAAVLHPEADPAATAPAHVQTNKAHQPKRETLAADKEAPIVGVVEQVGAVLEGGELDPVLQPLQLVIEPVQPVVEQLQSTLDPVLQAPSEPPELLP